MKPVMDVESVNSIAYDLAHDLDLNAKPWIIPALKSHVHTLAVSTLVGYDYTRCEGLLNRWIRIKCGGKLNPRSLP